MQIRISAQTLVYMRKKLLPVTGRSFRNTVDLLSYLAVTQSPMAVITPLLIV